MKEENRKKLERLNLEEVKKNYKTEEQTNQKGERRLRALVQKIDVPDIFLGRKLYLIQDYETNEYFVMHSHRLGIDEKVKQERKKLKAAAQDKLKAKKKEIRNNIKKLEKINKYYLSLGDDVESKKIAERIKEHRLELDKMPKRAQVEFTAIK